MVRGAGVAYTLKMDGTDKVLMTCYGEGAGAEGDAHEAFNFAAIYKLPEVFVCENNGFAISTPFQKEYAIQHVAQRAAGYGFPGVTVDGRDPVTCYAVAKEAVAQARAGGGPTLIECLVDRLGAHSSEDDQRRYRTQEEIDKLAESDCLERFKKRLIEEGVLTSKQVTELEEGVKEEVTTATKAGMDAADPQPEDALTNVYAVEAPKAIEPASGVETEEMNMAAALRSALTEEMDRDERVMVLGDAGLEDRDPLHALRSEGTAARGDPRPGPGAFLRAQAPLPDVQGARAEGRVPDPAAGRAHSPGGHRHLGLLLRADGALRDRGGEESRGGRRERGDHRPADRLPPGQGSDHRVRPQNREMPCPI